MEINLSKMRWQEERNSAEPVPAFRGTSALHYDRLLHSTRGTICMDGDKNKEAPGRREGISLCRKGAYSAR
jgi:hypothetical protein